MNQNTLYANFYQRWQEVTDLQPQTLGPLTPWYKRTVPFLKNSPWKILIPLAFILVCIGTLLAQSTAEQIASVLQRGF